MKSLFKLNLFLVLSCLFYLFPVPARADGVSDLQYSLTGVITLTGNNVCTPSPCTETIDFSFGLSYQFLPQYNVYAAYVGNIVASWSGALGSFTESSAGPPAMLGQPAPSGAHDSNYLGFGAGGGEVDLYLRDNMVSTPVVPSFFGASLYSCKTTNCVTDFALPQYSFPPPIYGLFLQATLSDVTVTAIPEPATMTLLASGLLMLGLVGATSRKLLT